MLIRHPIDMDWMGWRSVQGDVSDQISFRIPSLTIDHEAWVRMVGECVDVL